MENAFWGRTIHLLAETCIFQGARRSAYKRRPSSSSRTVSKHAAQELVLETAREVERSRLERPETPRLSDPAGARPGVRTGRDRAGLFVFIDVHSTGGEGGARGLGVGCRNFERSVLGCIEADFCNERFNMQHF